MRLFGEYKTRGYGVIDLPIQLAEFDELKYTTFYKGEEIEVLATEKVKKSVKKMRPPPPEPIRL